MGFKRLLTFLPFALVACSPPLPDLNVEEQWAEAMRQQSLFAVFPITEDLIVGDVLLDTRNVARNDNDAFEVIRLARTDPDLVLDALCQDRDRRLVIAPRPNLDNSGNERVTDRAGNQYIECPRPFANVGSALPKRFPPGYVPGDRLIGHSDSDAAIRLVRSDIPEATVARLTAAQLGAAGIFRNFAANLGFGGTGRVAMTIKLEDLESLEIPARSVLPLLRAGAARPSAIDPATVVAVLAQKWPEGARQLCQGNFDALRGKASIAIVTRVEYANEITFEFSESSEQALRAALDLSALVPDTEPPTSAPTINASGAATITVNGTTAEAAAANDDNPSNNASGAENRAAARLNSLLGAVTGGPTTGGVSGTLGIGTSGKLSLKAQYVRPMAVGAGARLTFPIEAALLPKTLDHVEVAVSICAPLLGIEQDFDRLGCSSPLGDPFKRLSGFQSKLCRDLGKVHTEESWVTLKFAP